MINTHDSKTLNAVNRLYESTIKHYFFSGYYQLVAVHHDYRGTKEQVDTDIR